jgi:tetratricopeptide (TPR) repeat protein
MTMRQENRTLAAPAESTAGALEAYLAAVEAGTAPPRAEFLARHPELAEDLDACLAAMHFIGNAAEGPRSVAAAAQEPEQAPGQLGDYRIVREVGRGGMGVVYEAEQVSLGRRVALKVLPFAATMDPRQLQRFHNEVRAAASLDHPHIVHVHAVGCERAVHFYAMQFIDGQTLAAMIADLRQRCGRPVPPEDQPTPAHPPVPPACPAADTVPQAVISTEGAPVDQAHFRRVAEWGIQAAEALDHAHALGIVHRDVKPANLLVDAHRKLWVTDFGLAHIQSDSRLTMTGDLVGTLRYMSPEQALAKRVVVDHRTDVYSLGATLYEMLTLEPVFAGNDRQELLRQIAFEEPVRPRRRHKAIPAELETIALKAMEKNPADRYATAKELADDLRRFLADETIRARRPSLRQRAQKWARRHRALVRATTALLLVLLLLGGVLWWREQQQRAAVEWAGDSNLERAELLRQQERWPEALAVLALAEGQLEGHGLGQLRQRVAQATRDVEMQTRLENARLQKAAGSKEAALHFAGADRLYGEAFAGYGLDVASLSPEAIAERVRASALGTQLITALDDWAAIKDAFQKGRGASLRTAVNLADDDPWRRRVREAATRRDSAQLEKLVEQEATWRQPKANLMLLATALGEARRWGAAEGLLRRAQQEHPADFRINFDLASILVFEKNPPDPREAAGFLRAALALRPQSPGVWTVLGVALAEQKKLAEGVAAYEKAIALQPDYALAYYNLGIALQLQKKPAEAVAACRKAIALQPDSGLAYSNLGNALRGQKKLGDAVAAYQKAIKLQPNLAAAYCNLGAALAEQKHPDEAATAYEKAIKLQPDLAEAHYNLGNALRGQKKLDEAVAAYQQAIDLQPDYAKAYCDLGIALARQKKLDKAVAAYEKAIALQPDYAEAYSNLGIALRGQKKLDKAVAAFEKAIKLPPAFAEAYYNLGDTLAEQKQLDEAVAAFEKAIARWPNDARAYNNLGIVLARQKKLAKAVAAYQQATKLDPGYALAFNNLGAALVEQKQLGEAVAAFQKATKLQPDDAKAYYNLGLALQLQKQPAEAVAAFQKTIDLQPNLAAAYSSLGVALAEQKGHAAAVRFFREAFADKPQLADDLNAQPRYNAACAAALAGSGQGKDADQLDAKARAHLRRQALDWLRADLEAYRQLLEKSAGKAGSMIARRMRDWLRDDDFAGVRAAEALARLPEAERQDWQQLWADVAATLATAQKQGAPAEKGSPPQQGP